MVLQVILDGNAVDTCARRHGIAAEEEAEHGGAGKAPIVAGPDHLGIGIAGSLVGKRGARRRQFGEIHATASSVQPGAPSPPVQRLQASWCGVDEYVDAMGGGALDNGAQVAQIGFVVAAGAGMLHGFPGHEQTLEGQSPGAQAREMLVRLLERKGSAHKRRRAMVQKAGGEVRGPVRRIRHLAAAGEIDAAQQEGAAGAIHEPGTFCLHLAARGGLINHVYHFLSRVVVVRVIIVPHAPASIAASAFGSRLRKAD